MSKSSVKDDALVRRLAQRYTSGAQGYAEYWLPMLAPMSERLLDLLPLTEASQVLDIGCGPGTLTDVIRGRNESALIVGIDRSSGMLRRAPSLSGTAKGLMDARYLAFSPHSFDTVLMAFVLFHYPDKIEGLREVRRVLRPGGVLGTATFQSSPSFEAKRVWEQCLSNVTPPDPTVVTDLSAVDSVEETNHPEKMKTLLEAAGFENITTHVEDFIYQWQPDDYIAIRSSFGSSSEIFNTLSLKAQSNLIDLVHARFSELSPADFRFAPTALYAIARQSQ